MMLPARKTNTALNIPSTGITLLEGPGFYGKEIRFVVQHWTAVLLSQDHAVHWIDGGHRFDPSDFFPVMRSLNCNLEEGLRRLYIGRGFTLHQLHALIRRERHEVTLTKASMVVIDGMLAMFLDDQIKRFEARSILRHCMDALEELSHICPVVVLDGETASPLHQQLKHTMKPYIAQRLRGVWVDRKRRQLRFLDEKNRLFIELHTSVARDQQQRSLEFTSIDPNV